MHGRGLTKSPIWYHGRGQAWPSRQRRLVQGTGRSGAATGREYAAAGAWTRGVTIRSGDRHRRGLNTLRRGGALESRSAEQPLQRRQLWRLCRPVGLEPCDPCSPRNGQHGPATTSGRARRARRSRRTRFRGERHQRVQQDGRLVDPDWTLGHPSRDPGFGQGLRDVGGLGGVDMNSVPHAVNDSDTPTSRPCRGCSRSATACR